ncbi:hypothetical protein ACIQD3_02880 [Peribacillus loiseleuriae]|uniref:hypothetical protein n=1 Tax=Peribacillus loiseleuriae TaxID=1679170 RepID=UPI0037FA4636
MKKQPCYDLVTDFGAENDGTINDLQIKFNLLQDGDEVFVPIGVFILKPFSLVGKKKIRFVGPGTLKRDIITLGNFITLDGCNDFYFEINIDNSDFSSSAIYMKNCPSFIFSKMKVKNLYSSTSTNVHGVQIFGGCSFGKFVSCEFSDIRASDESTASARAIMITNFNVIENQTICIEIKECEFSNMTKGSDTDAIFIDQLNFYGYHRIIENRFIDIIKRPVKLMGDGNVVRGNKLIHNGIIGPSYAAFSSYGNDNTIDDNEAYGFGNNGRWSRFVDCNGTATIRRNKFYNSAATDVSTSDGVYIYGNNRGITDITIEDNEFKNLRYGTYLYTSVPVTNMKINKNKYSSINKHIHYFRSVVTNLLMEGNSTSMSPQNFCSFDSGVNPATFVSNNNLINCLWGLINSPSSRIENLFANGNTNFGTSIPDYEAGKQIEYRTSLPLSGKYEQGDKIIHKTPINGGNIGWVCTTTGTVGIDAVFKTYGTIAN